MGLAGYCEHIGDERPCDLCPEEDGAVCTPVLGLHACVLPCETDEDCPSPATCTGTTDAGGAFCSTTGSNDGGPAHPNAPTCTIWSVCTCVDDEDCHQPGTVCVPNEG